MISRQDLPDDAAEWTNVFVSFPHLEQDTADSCPASEDEIFDYVQMESTDLESAERSRLRFVRTAHVADVSYWLWEYTDEDRQVCYVFFRQNLNSSTVLGLTEPNGLSHEQYLLADYYEEVYWS